MKLALIVFFVLELVFITVEAFAVVNDAPSEGFSSFFADSGMEYLP